MSRCKSCVVHTGLFPAEAGPTKHRVPRRTGFSRESVGCHAANLVLFRESVRRLAAYLVLSIPASSRLKPVPLNTAYTQEIGSCRIPCGTGFSREGVRRLAAYLVLSIPAPSRLKPFLLDTAYTQEIGSRRLPWGTGFSREGVGRHAANLVLYITASSRLKPFLLDTAYTQEIGSRRLPWGTGFSREGVGRHAANLVLYILASSRLKPVLQIHRDHRVGLALASPADTIAHMTINLPSPSGKMPDLCRNHPQEWSECACSV